MATLDEVLTKAVAAYDGNQAKLARAIERSPSVVGNWRMKRYQPDYESCLRLAQITREPATEVLLAAGHDPSLLPQVDGDVAADWRVQLAQYKRVIGELKRLLDPLTGNKHAEGWAA